VLVSPPTCLYCPWRSRGVIWTPPPPAYSTPTSLGAFPPCRVFVSFCGWTSERPSLLRDSFHVSHPPRYPLCGTILLPPCFRCSALHLEPDSSAAEPVYFRREVPPSLFFFPSGVSQFDPDRTGRLLRRFFFFPLSRPFPCVRVFTTLLIASLFGAPRVRLLRFLKG